MQMDSLSAQPGSREADLGPSHCDAVQHTSINAQRPPFDGLTISLHWMTALLVLALFATAWLYAVVEEQNSDLAPLLLRTHRSLGGVVWAVTALRLGWRLTRARLPPFPAQMTMAHRAVVKLSEYGLYLLLLGQPVTGLLTTLLGGRPFGLLVWQIKPLLLRDDSMHAAFLFSHELGAWTLAILVAGHAGVALFHHFVRRDDVLACMAPGVAVLGAKKSRTRTAR
jgi:cytochrome b561